MCGIAGILRRDGGTIPDEWLDLLDARIAHRGPDGSGRFRDRVDLDGRTMELAFVHRRLSIIDHDDGAQPMVSESGRSADEGRVVVCFNGCIYNHRELRAELIAAGHTFATDHSDTEVLIHAYREWGQQFEDHLEGMYAFALWDRTDGRVVLSRDWFGEKPLYVRFNPCGLEDAMAFSSDAHALAKLEGEAMPRDGRASDLWLSAYLQLGYNARGATVYDGLSPSSSGVPNGVFAPPPTIVAHAASLIPERPSREISVAQVDELLGDAVRSRLEADVPLGCFLSGGVDSSLIAHYAQNEKEDLRTFTVRMPDERYDESSWAEQAAAHLDTDHQTLDVAMEPASDLVHLVRTLGQPFGDSSILPTYWVSNAARRHVKVALSGDGADELFFGYERHVKARSLHRHRRLLQWIPKSFGVTAHPKSFRHRLGRLGAMARDYPALGVMAMESIFTRHQISDLMEGPERSEFSRAPGRDAMASLRSADLQSYLPNDLLCKVDTASMAVGLEVRAPFLDRRLARAVMDAPTWVLVPKGKRKGLLREVAAKYLPRELVDRPKSGFAIPISDWFRNDFGGMRGLLEDRLRGASSPFGPLGVRQDAVAALMHEHLDGGIDHGQRLFALLTLAIWAQDVWAELV